MRIAVKEKVTIEQTYSLTDLTTLQMNAIQDAVLTYVSHTPFVDARYREAAKVVLCEINKMREGQVPKQHRY